MLLENKTAVVYGGAGTIGGAVARAFAREGARVHLAGRTLRSLEQVAEEIRAAGATAETAQVDALDETAVDEHADAVAAAAGGIDVCFNAISLDDVHGTPLVEMSLEVFERPIRNAVRTTFLTARAAARHMIGQRSGVILTFGGGGGRDPIRDYFIGGSRSRLARSTSSAGSWLPSWGRTASASSPWSPAASSNRSPATTPSATGSST